MIQIHTLYSVINELLSVFFPNMKKMWYGNSKYYNDHLLLFILKKYTVFINLHRAETKIWLQMLVITSYTSIILTRYSKLFKLKS